MTMELPEGTKFPVVVWEHESKENGAFRGVVLEDRSLVFERRVEDAMGGASWMLVSHTVGQFISDAVCLMLEAKSPKA